MAEHDSSPDNRLRTRVEAEAGKLAHKFHMLEARMERLDEASRDGAVAELVQLRGAMESLRVLNPRDDGQVAGAIETAEGAIDRTFDRLSTLEKDRAESAQAALGEARVLLADLKGAAAMLPGIAEYLGVNPARADLVAPALPDILPGEAAELSPLIRTGQAGVGNDVPQALSTSRDSLTGALRVEARPARVTMRLKAVAEHSEAPLERGPVDIYGVKEEGAGVALIAQAGTNDRGYAALDLDASRLAEYERVAVTFGSPELRDIMDVARGARVRPEIAILERSDVLGPQGAGGLHNFHLPDAILDKLRGKGGGRAQPDTPDATDMALDPEAFAFDDHLEDGNRCIRPRPEISPRNYTFTQVIRTDPAVLVEGGEKAPLRDVSAPIPMDLDEDNRAANMSAVAGNLARGKLITYRQYWSPVAQGLGKLLYSLALAPREEVKIAIVDWQRTATASRRDRVSATEELQSDLERDTEVEDIVRSSLVDESEGGSSADTSAEATNKPSAGSYLVSGALGFLVGGPVGAVAGIAANHFIRPDTGSTGSTEAENWTRGMREISLDATKRVSDRVTQTASSRRDLRSSVVTTAREAEQEEVRTRTVRNHNQNHAMTVQYYQVLAHYRVVTEAQSQRDVIFVPYAIDRRVFEKLPEQSKFLANPYRFEITRFLLRHGDTLERIVPARLGRGMDALRRLVHDADEYREISVSARRWIVSAEQPVTEAVSLFLDTDGGVVPLYRRDAAGTVFTSRPVRIEEVRKLVFRYEATDAVTAQLERLRAIDGLVNTDPLVERIMNTELSLGAVRFRARPDRRWYSSEERYFEFQAQDPDVTLSLAHPKAVVEFDAVTDAALDDLIDPKRTRQGRDYEALEALVLWINANPMTVLQAIWLTEDPSERALRFQRFRYGDKSLLDHIENKPCGVDGNYVAFPLAQGLAALEPLDVSGIRTERAISVPTRGVFAETYLSCNNATERRDVTRRLDQENMTPFAAPEISPVGTGSRRGMPVPGQGALPGNIVSIQQPPTAPGTAAETALSALMSGSPFPNMSNGAEAIAAAQALADTAMKLDADKQRQYLDAAKAILEGVGNAGLMAAGMPPVLDFAGDNGPMDYSAIGQAIRTSDPARNYDHLQVAKEARKDGQITPDQENTSAEHVTGASDETSAGQGGSDGGGGGGGDAAETGGTNRPRRVTTDRHVEQISPNQVLLFNFATGSSQLHPDHEAALKILAAKVTGPDSIDSVWGHASPLGNESDNQTLSEQRSRAVFDALLEYSANKRHPGPFNVPDIVGGSGENVSLREVFADIPEVGTVPGRNTANDPLERAVLVTFATPATVDDTSRRVTTPGGLLLSLIGRLVFLGPLFDDISVNFDNSETVTNQDSSVTIKEGDTITRMERNETRTITNNRGDTYNITVNGDGASFVVDGVQIVEAGGEARADGGPGGDGAPTTEWLLTVRNPGMAAGQDIESFLRDVLGQAFGGQEGSLAAQSFQFFGEVFAGGDPIDFLITTALDELGSSVAGLALQSIQVGTVKAAAVLRKADRSGETSGTFRGIGLAVQLGSVGTGTHAVIVDEPYSTDTPYDLATWNGRHDALFYADAAVDGALQLVASFLSDLVLQITTLRDNGLASSAADSALDLVQSVRDAVAGIGTGVTFEARDGAPETYAANLSGLAIRAIGIQRGQVEFIAD